LNPAKEEEEEGGTPAEAGGWAALKNLIMSLNVMRPRAAASIEARYLQVGRWSHAAEAYRHVEEDVWGQTQTTIIVEQMSLVVKCPSYTYMLAGQSLPPQNLQGEGWATPASTYVKMALFSFPEILGSAWRRKVPNSGYLQ
jgi:hypothetical protein